MKKLHTIQQIKIANDLWLYEKGQVPYGILILASDREKLMRYLEKRGLWTQIQWKDIPEISSLSEVSDKRYKMNLFIPCDDRLAKRELKKYIRAIRGYYCRRGNCGKL